MCASASASASANANASTNASTNATFDNEETPYPSSSLSSSSSIPIPIPILKSKPHHNQSAAPKQLTLEEKAKRWSKVQSKRYSHRKQFTTTSGNPNNQVQVQVQKDALPTEHIRTILQDTQ